MSVSWFMLQSEPIRTFNQEMSSILCFISPCLCSRVKPTVLLVIFSWWSIQVFRWKNSFCRIALYCHSILFHVIEFIAKQAIDCFLFLPFYMALCSLKFFKFKSKGSNAKKFKHIDCNIEPYREDKFIHSDSACSYKN